MPRTAPDTAPKGAPSTALRPAPVIRGGPVEAPKGIRQIFKSDDVRTVIAPELLGSITQAETDRLAELERLVGVARAEGYASGVEAGSASTLAAGQDAVLRAAAALEQLTAKVCGEDERNVTVASTLMLQTALQVAEWVVRRELTEDGKAVLGRLEAGLHALLPSPTTRIAVSHADHALVAEWADGRGRIGTVVVADQRLAPGDAVVTTDAGQADLTVAAALHTAAEALGLPSADATAR